MDMHEPREVGHTSVGDNVVAELVQRAVLLALEQVRVVRRLAQLHHDVQQTLRVLGVAWQSKAKGRSVSKRGPPVPYESE